MSDDFTLLDHYTILIYPFLHSVMGDSRQRQVRSLDESWAPWWSRLNGDTYKALDDTYFFLPYIREVMFPETAVFKDEAPGDRYANWVKRIEQWNVKGLNYFCSEIPQDTILRITYKKELLSSIQNIEIHTIIETNERIDHFLIPTYIEWIDAMLFPSGIGFFVLKLVLKDDSPNLSSLINLNYYLRMIHPPNLDFKLPSLLINRMSISVTMRDLMDFLMQGMFNDGLIISDLVQFINHLNLAKPMRLSESEAGQVYGERCNVFSYACIDLKEENLPKALAGVFDSLKDRLVFEFATAIPIGEAVNNPQWIPSSEYVRKVKDQKQISFWRAWRGLALKEGVAFLATEDTNFNRRVLPHNIENDYLPLYLYSLYQKYQLFLFANELMCKGAYMARHLLEVRALMNQFMNFRNKYWFSDVTRKPLGSELYHRFQHGMESPALYDLVSSQVRELKEYYEEQRQRRIDTLLNLLTFFFLPLGVVVGIFGMTFFNGSWKSFTLITVITFIISLGIWKWGTEEFGPHIK
jgi:hypothetical protein